MPPAPDLASRRTAQGFTLIEIMIAVVVVAILAAVALPSFMDSIRKSRRSDAFNAINAVQQAQERVRANWSQYCGTLGAPPDASSCGLNLAASTPNGHYSIALSSASATGYVVTAAATGSQAADTRCAKMAARMLGGALSYGSGTNSIDWSDPNRCWAK